MKSRAGKICIPPEVWREFWGKSAVCGFGGKSGYNTGMPREKSVQYLAQYLKRMRDARPMATPETSYYGELEELFNAVGGELSPKVAARQQPKISADWTPDFGFYTAPQIKRHRGEKDGEIPARGVAEIKGLSASLAHIVRGDQVKKYAEIAGTVLVSNYREFALAKIADNNKIVEIARSQIAATEEEFWQKAKNPIKTAEECGDAVCEFLRRALSHNAQINRPEEVARNLASYTRQALAVLENNKDESALSGLQTALETALNMKFTGENGKHLFRSTLAQTVFYGLFSAWMNAPDKSRFDWRSAAHYLKTPVMQDLFGDISAPSRLESLGLREILDGAAEMLRRVQSKLFSEISAQNAVLHFYEPFLEAFDSKLRTNMGVWYTPKEIVRYMVERADRVLREELKIADGLADNNVYVLDPCGGTGAYIAEVLHRIHKTCKERGDGDAAALAVKEAAQKRIIGFEILSAPYIISHWLIGAILEQYGAPFKDGERAAVYLTNSLTNWEKLEKIQPILGFPGLQEERDAANKIKQEQPILVILGNPPYNAFAGTSPKEEEGLVEPYKKGLREKWGINSGNINDLYVRFFRMAENKIAKNGKGVVSFISNYSYTETPLFVVMRESLLKNFNKIWIDSLNGDSRRTGKKTPDGLPDPSVFSTPMNKAGIRVGTVIGTYMRKQNGGAPSVKYRDFWGKEKRQKLEKSLDAPHFESTYETAKPKTENKFSFRPIKINGNFLNWLPVDKLHGGEISPGLEEGRGGMLIDSSREILEKRMHDYFNPDINWESYQKRENGLTKNYLYFNAKTARDIMLSEGFKAENITPYMTLALDNGFCYYPNMDPLWRRPCPRLWKYYKPGNSFFISRPKDMGDKEGAPAFYSKLFGSRGAINDARYIPFYIYTDGLQGGKKMANLSGESRTYLEKLNFPNPDKNEESAEIIWLHSLAVCYSPKYQTENADGLKIGWPRIPLPEDAESLKDSAKLGAKIRDLLDMEKRLDWQTWGGKKLVKISNLKNPSGENCAVSGWWGHKDGKGKVYPGSGKTEEMPCPPDYDAEKLGVPLSVWLNGKIKWYPVPSRAWEYRIGGFQPPKKWLSYRVEKIINRPLTADESGRLFPDIIRRISALILLESELDVNYEAVKIQDNER